MTRRAGYLEFLAHKPEKKMWSTRKINYLLLWELETVCGSFGIVWGRVQFLCTFVPCFVLQGLLFLPQGKGLDSRAQSKYLHQVFHERYWLTC